MSSIKDSLSHLLEDLKHEISSLLPVDLEAEFAVRWGFLAPLHLMSFAKVSPKVSPKNHQSSDSLKKVLVSNIRVTAKKARRFPSYFRVLQVGFNDFSAMAKFW